MPDCSEELECSSCCLSQLLTVNIKVRTNFKHVMSLIRFILANSSSVKTLTLNTLTLNVGLGFNKSDMPILFNISRDLLWMKRASQEAPEIYIWVVVQNLRMSGSPKFTFRNSGKFCYFNLLCLDFFMFFLKMMTHEWLSFLLNGLLNVSVLFSKCLVYLVLICSIAVLYGFLEVLHLVFSIPILKLFQQF